MTDTQAPELAALLAETDASAKDLAWARLLKRHSGLLLHAARSFGAGYDGTMDRWTILDPHRGQRGPLQTAGPDQEPEPGGHRRAFTMVLANVP